MLSLRSLTTGIALSVCILFTACTASKSITETQTRLRRIDDFRSVDMESTTPLLDKYRKGEEDQVLYHLEYAMLNHYRNEWQESSKHFKSAEAAIEKYYTKSINRNLQAMLVNDLQLAYKGEFYEDVYLNVFNALNYLHQSDTQGALVEARRVTHKLEQLSDRYKGLASSLMKRDTAQTAVKQADEKLEDVDLLSTDDEPPQIQQNSALGRFLTTVLNAKAGERDNARIELQKLRTALADQGQTGYLTALAGADHSGPSESASYYSPDFWMQEEWAAADVLSTLFEQEFELVGSSAPRKEATDSTGVSVPAPGDLKRSDAYNTLFLCFSGRPPKKSERQYDLPLVINDETVQLHFAVPVLDTPESRVARVQAITVGDTLQVPVIEDMQSVAHEMFDKKKPVIYTRAVIRSFIKMGATEGAEAAARDEMGDAAGFLAEQAGNIMSHVSAQADVRGWQTMPGKAHAVVARLPEGTHSVTFEFLSEQGQVLKRRHHKVTVGSEQDLALAESIFLK